MYFACRSCALDLSSIPFTCIAINGSHKSQHGIVSLEDSEQMESLSRFELTKTESRSVDETELAEVRTTLPTNNAATSTPQQPGGVPCRNNGCKSWSSRSESRLESPWHFLKTVFLVSVIVALVLWVIVYASLSQYRVL
ncbi:uncharacterized protein LOC116433665 isoform X3 [Nomia melanderi]|uniref:uncharacterized protein LOC116433665 isoform X3 n=1 Tax=Nomia melanderi TaxID=2448451 RepID=UPI00130478B8|nr:uncharacterized protein LOC116433665 isoform X3 [Nomia melanderi]